MPRSPESIERRKTRARERAREVYAERKRDYKAKYAKDPEAKRAASRKYYEKNKARATERKRLYRERNKERVLEYQRKYYEQNKERLRGIIYAGKSRRNPTRGLYTAVQECLAGRITVDELVRLYGSALARLDERVNGKRAGSFAEEVRSGDSSSSVQLREEHPGDHEAKA